MRCLSCCFSSERPIEKSSSFPPPWHKTLQGGALFFIALSAISVGTSFLPSSPLMLKRILRIGGSAGIGVGGILLGFFIWMPTRRKEETSLGFKMRDMTPTSTFETFAWEETVLSSLKSSAVWEGWVRFKMLHCGEILDYTMAINWCAEAERPTSNKEHIYYLPVRVTHSGADYFLAFPEAEEKKPILPSDSPYSVEQVQKKLQERLSSQ